MKKIFIILGVLLLAGAGTAFAWQKGYLPENISSLVETAVKKLPPLDLVKKSITQDLPETIKNTDLKTVAQDAGDQITTLSSRAGDLSDQTKNILGSSVQVNEEDKPLHEKAFEYGQYVYCQQVVKEFEEKMETNPTEEN